MLNKKLNAFTLAEVLITLVIIGIVAALTIPTAINNYRKQEYVAGLKKANSVLSQALYKMTENNGYPVGDYSYLKEKEFIDEFEKVVSVIKRCNNFSQCFGKNLNGGYKELNNGPWAIIDGKSLITADGQMYEFAKLGSNASLHGLSADDVSNNIWRILVDINGEKNPNQAGYDTFIFYIVEGKGIVPAGSNSANDCNKSSHGWTCAAKVLRENAINY